MSIHRKAPSKKESWLSKFWHWLIHNAQPENEEDDLYPQPPEAAPAKDPSPQSQTTLYKMLEDWPRRIAGNAETQTPKLQVYDYCGVVFYKADTVYHYINPGIDLCVGDRVLVPVNIHGSTEMAEGIVVSSGEYLAQCAPYPVSQASMIVKKL